MIIPAGIFKSGTVLMKSNVELYLEKGSTLLAGTDYCPAHEAKKNL